MATSQRPRKAYKPRAKLIDPVTYVTAGFKYLDEVGDELVTLRIKNHSALAAMTQGRATSADFNMLVSALNVTEALMMQELGAQYSPVLKAGQDALTAIGHRCRSIGRFVLRAEEMTALNLAMEVHDAQLDVCTVAQIERAIINVRNTIVSGKAKRI